jgi:hypothetical protein
VLHADLGKPLEHGLRHFANCRRRSMGARRGEARYARIVRLVVALESGWEDTPSGSAVGQ